VLQTVRLRPQLAGKHSHLYLDRRQMEAFCVSDSLSHSVARQARNSVGSGCQRLGRVFFRASAVYCISLDSTVFDECPLRPANFLLSHDQLVISSSFLSSTMRRRLETKCGAPQEKLDILTGTSDSSAVYIWNHLARILYRHVSESLSLGCPLMQLKNIFVSRVRILLARLIAAVQVLYASGPPQSDLARSRILLARLSR